MITEALLVFLLMLINILHKRTATLIVGPRDTEVTVNDTTYLNCSTSLATNVQWRHGNLYVYTGIILQPYNERFTIEGNRVTRAYNLVIRSVQPQDAGEYQCQDDEGSGESRYAQLIVLENDTICSSNMQSDGVIGQNVFNIPPDEVHLTCNVTYYGNIPPQLQWIKAGDTISTIDGVMSDERTNNRVDYALKLKGDISLDNSSYICQTTRATQNQYKCNTETIKVLYIIGGNREEQTVYVGEQISCVAHNGTMPCSSQWYHDNYTCPLSCDENITTHLLGVYMCTVKCSVRGTDYFHETLKVSVVEATTSPPSDAWYKISMVLMLCVVPIIVLMACAIVVLLCQRFSTSNPRRTERGSGG